MKIWNTYRKGLDKVWNNSQCNCFNLGFIALFITVTYIVIMQSVEGILVWSNLNPFSSEFEHSWFWMILWNICYFLYMTVYAYYVGSLYNKVTK